jgi:hypothetical protein
MNFVLLTKFRQAKFLRRLLLLSDGFPLSISISATQSTQSVGTSLAVANGINIWLKIKGEDSTTQLRASRGLIAPIFATFEFKIIMFAR